MKMFEESWTSEASRKKWLWVLRTFEEWRTRRNRAVSLDNENYGDEPLINRSLDEMSDDELDFCLARFIAEVRRTDGAEYPGIPFTELAAIIFIL